MSNHKVQFDNLRLEAEACIEEMRALLAQSPQAFLGWNVPQAIQELDSAWKLVNGKGMKSLPPHCLCGPDDSQDCPKHGS